VWRRRFDARIDGTVLMSGGWYDVNKDGRFLIPTQVEQPANLPITVVVNWTAALKR
jgi:hypothetical protein